MKNSEYTIALPRRREPLGVIEVIQVYRRLKWYYLREWRSELTNKQVWFRVLWAFYGADNPAAHYDEIADTLHLIDGLPHSGKVTGTARVILYKKITLN